MSGDEGEAGGVLPAQLTNEAEHKVTSGGREGDELPHQLRRLGRGGGLRERALDIEEVTEADAEGFSHAGGGRYRDRPASGLQPGEGHWLDADPFGQPLLRVAPLLPQVGQPTADGPE